MAIPFVRLAGKVTMSVTSGFINLCTLIFAGTLSVNAANAQSLESQCDPQEDVPIWLNAGLLSHHFDRNRGYREDNYGFGAQVEFTPENALMLGEFRNSDNATSHYVGWLWQPIQWGPVKLGGVAGGFDGYPLMRHGGWFAAALPMASIQEGPVGITLTVVPNYKDRLHGAIAAQFILRVW